MKYENIIRVHIYIDTSSVFVLEIKTISKKNDRETGYCFLRRMEEGIEILEKYWENRM